MQRDKPADSYDVYADCSCLRTISGGMAFYRVGRPTLYRTRNLFARYFRLQ